jgi:signal peptidase I
MFVSVRAIGATLKIGALRALLCIVLVGGVIGYTVIPLADRIGSHVPSYLMPNAAMLPTIRPDERFLLSPKETLSRGDIVVFARKRRDPHYGTFVRQFVKRVVGLPGDVIAMSGGIISINGESAKRERMGDFAVAEQDGRTKLLPRFLETLPNGVRYGVLDSDPNRTLGDAVHRVGADQIFLLGDNRDDADDMPDSYDVRPMPAHPGLVWLDRVDMKETAMVAAAGSKHQ